MVTFSNRSVVVLLAIAAAPYSASWASGQGLSAEVANTVTNEKGQSVTTRGRFYRSSDGKTREEVSGRITIVDINARTVTLLVPERREAFIFSVPSGKDAPRRPQVDPGRASVPTSGVHNGRPVSKVRYNDGSQPVAQEIWTDVATGLLVRHQATVGAGVIVKEMSIVDVVEPAEDLFTVPPDYSVKRAPLPSGPAVKDSLSPPRPK